MLGLESIIVQLVTSIIGIVFNGLITSLLAALFGGGAAA